MDFRRFLIPFIVANLVHLPSPALALTPQMSTWPRLNDDLRSARVVRNKWANGSEKTENYVHTVLRTSLPREWRSQTSRIAETLLTESRRHGFDPLFILALIKIESGFNPHARSNQAAVGLMQLRPDTAKWIARRNNLPWTGARSLRDPQINLRIGTAYLSFLRESFDSRRDLYLCAYNWGPGNVHRAVGRKRIPQQYPRKVASEYNRLRRQLRTVAGLA